MNHDDVLKDLAIALKNVIKEFDADIDAITINKIKIDCRQNMDKAVHWAVFMSKMLDDLNAYLTYFGGEEMTPDYVKCISCKNLHFMKEPDGRRVYVCFNYPWDGVVLCSRINSPREKRKCINYEGVN